MRVLILGCGYIGLPLATELVKQGHEVFGVRRSQNAVSTLEAVGVKPILADITHVEELSKIPLPFDWIVNTTGATQASVEQYNSIYLNAARNIIDWLTPHPPKKYVYISSTAVYGQSNGVLVSENSPMDPVSPTSRILVETEKVLLNAVQEKKFPAIILRSAGIYGPNRGYYLLKYLDGEARIPGQGDRLANMIHRDDLVGILLTVLKSAHPGQIYNAVDDEPTPIVRLFRWLSESLARDMPPFVRQSIEEQGRGSKRVSNRKLKMELGYQFKYPTFRQGCTAEIQRLEEEGKL